MRHPRRPTQILLLGRRIKIRYTRKALYAEDGEEASGLSDLNHGLIDVSLNQSLWNIKETVWHEVKHQINFAARLHDTSTEEDHADRASPAEIAVMRDNPQLMKWLMHRE